MYYLYVRRENDWHLVGQYANRRQAERMADDYRSRGEVCRIDTD